MIKFVCGCGKHLKARDEMAARRSMCPRCGNPVGIPSLEPANPEGLAPLTPLERLRLARNRKQPLGEPSAWTPPPPGETLAPEVDATPERPGKRRKSRGWQAEETWQECLMFPRHAWQLCFGVAVALTLLSGLAAIYLPRLLAEPVDEPREGLQPSLAGILLVALGALIGCGFLACVLDSAVDEKAFARRWARSAVLTVLLGVVRWLAGFLAGPIVFAATGALYWVICVEPAPLDLLILAELAVAGLAYWILALLAVAAGGLRALHPLAVTEVAQRLRWRVLGVLLAALVLLGHGWLILLGLAGVNEGALRGWVLLEVGWFSGVFWSTALCRLLGGWYRRSPAVVESI